MPGQIQQNRHRHRTQNDPELHRDTQKLGPDPEKEQEALEPPLPGHGPEPDRKLPED